MTTTTAKQAQDLYTHTEREREKGKDKEASAIPYESRLSICIITRKPLLEVSCARLAVDLRGNRWEIQYIVERLKKKIQFVLASYLCLLKYLLIYVIISLIIKFIKY